MPEKMLPEATTWADNPYEPEWAERDFLFSPDGNKEYPQHACKQTYLLAKPFIKQFRNALDIGCRVGEFTRYLHLDFAHVYAFDPNLWPDFRRNVDLGRVTHFTCAIGDERGETVMFGGGHAERENARTKIVPVYTIDAFGFDAIDFIKIDVEGFEKKVLLGAAQTIERCNPVIVIEQNHVVLDGDAQYSAKEYLETIGYKVAALDRRGWDFVMVRP
ncbi:FkbM family methyltransferase [Novosphingobium piscinae]|uniref:FkbM family methyltransferase n=1 Tax=Novosphingobium piscinae TaxID=1507448 RepID=A0A7X1FY56_9SPHN|nr:FkbM family methyltransferase [Novosphingobium piscinae]MBC2669061.1 FkbM family methyltransferase [Novosphingobium piscinae]